MFGFFKGKENEMAIKLLHFIGNETKTITNAYSSSSHFPNPT